MPTVARSRELKAAQLWVEFAEARPTTAQCATASRRNFTARRLAAEDSIDPRRSLFWSDADKQLNVGIKFRQSQDYVVSQETLEQFPSCPAHSPAHNALAVVQAETCTGGRRRTGDNHGNFAQERATCPQWGTAQKTKGSDHQAVASAPRSGFRTRTGQPRCRWPCRCSAGVACRRAVPAATLVRRRGTRTSRCCCRTRRLPASDARSPHGRRHRHRHRGGPHRAIRVAMAPWRRSVRVFSPLRIATLTEP